MHAQANYGTLNFRKTKTTVNRNFNNKANYLGFNSKAITL